MRGKFKLTGAGIAVVIAIVLFCISIIYTTLQPKQVQYIYERIDELLHPGALREPARPDV